MCLRIESTYEQNQIVSECCICGRHAGGRFSPPVRYMLIDDDIEYGDVCERCAYGSIDLWRVAMIEHAIRLETEAALLRSLTVRLDDAEPAPEGIAEDLIRKNTSHSNNRFFPPR
jgi:hypothetical protein